MIDPVRVKQLILATAGRDESAFQALYDLTSPKLFAVALRICREPTLAEDVLQETFVAIWRGAGTFDAKRGSPLGWLTVIARNRALDAMRKGKRTDQPIEENEIDTLTHIQNINAARADYADLDALAHCLERLDEKQKSAVLLAYYEGRTREELSARFDAPVNTIKTWLRRGLTKLRMCLEE